MAFEIPVILHTLEQDVVGMPALQNHLLILPIVRRLLVTCITTAWLFCKVDLLHGPYH